MSLTLRKAFNPTERTRTEAMLYVMDHSRAGALVQLLIMEALGRNYEPTDATKHRPGESNADVLARLIEADRLLGRESAYDALLAYAKPWAGLSPEAAEKAMGKAAGMINPLAWVRAAEDVKAALEAAQPDPEPAPKLADHEQAQVSVTVKNGRYGEVYLSETFGEDAARAELGATLDRLLRGKPGRSLTVELTLDEAAQSDDDED